MSHLGYFERLKLLLKSVISEGRKVNDYFSYPSTPDNWNVLIVTNSKRIKKNKF